MNSSIASENEIAVPMSFREKSAWACLCSTLAVYGPYFGYVFGQIAHGTLAVVSLSAAFLIAMVLQTILLIVTHAIFALGGKPLPKDERDLAIEARSYRCAYIVFAAGVWTAAGGALSWAGARSADPAFHHTMLLMLQALLLPFVAAETTRHLVQVIGYRRGH